jgi:uncharacterized protein YacL
MILVELIRLIVVVAMTAAGYQYGEPGRLGLPSGSPETVRLVASIIGAAAGYVLGGVFGRSLLAGVGVVERRVERIQAGELLTRGIGLVAGGIAALFVGIPVVLFVPNRLIAYSGVAVAFLTLCYAGLRVAARKSFELLGLMGLSQARTFAAQVDRFAGGPKVLDTSAIIDGRIVDVARSGFLAGHLICPAFVLVELRAIADSVDQSRRAKGRRGLEMLEALQGEPNVLLEVREDAVPGAPDVDGKLIALVRKIGGVLLTTDFNLHKTAALQGTPVLNINSLAASLKAVILPGEEIEVQIRKRGTQVEQGVGYLDDGTMVVVEGASGFVGQTVDAVVANVLQTAGGRMVFATAKERATASPAE